MEGKNRRTFQQEDRLLEEDIHCQTNDNSCWLKTIKNSHKTVRNIFSYGQSSGIRRREQRDRENNEFLTADRHEIIPNSSF